jgi:hypothetical protein
VKLYPGHLSGCKWCRASKISFLNILKSEDIPVQCISQVRPVSTDPKKMQPLLRQGPYIMKNYRNTLMIFCWSNRVYPVIVCLTALVHAQDPHSDSYSPTSSNSIVDVSLERELARQALEDAEKRKIYQAELNQEFSVSPQDWDGLGLCLRLVANPDQTF